MHFAIQFLVPMGLRVWQADEYTQGRSVRVSGPAVCVCVCVCADDHVYVCLSMCLLYGRLRCCKASLATPYHASFFTGIDSTRCDDMMVCHMYVSVVWCGAVYVRSMLVHDSLLPLSLQHETVMVFLL